MSKPWSITTTTRNPYRLQKQLRILKDHFTGLKWNKDNQANFQIRLIQNRLFGYSEEHGFSKQFLKKLSPEQQEIFTDFTYQLSFEEAKQIFLTKNYQDPPMRGRQSFNPFKKFGFVTLEGKTLKLTVFGENFLSGQFDLSEIFFRAFIKWQLPNPDQKQKGYNIKPFIATLHLIKKVNTLAIARNEKAKGISKEEFSLLGPTLINYQDIDKYAEMIMQLRSNLKGKSKAEAKLINDNFKYNFAKEFLGSDDNKKIKELLKNLKDYGDNALRYFRLTGYFYTRGNGYYIDLEKRRFIEIESLLTFDNATATEFKSETEYLDYISDISQPKLPWEIKNKFTQIIQNLINEIQEYEKDLDLKQKEILEYQSFSDNQLKNYIVDLKIYRKFLQNKNIHNLSQDTNKVKEYIDVLETIYKLDNKPLVLEQFSTLGLYALNDAIEIRPNYPVGDDNVPTFTAPPGKPDIECFYESFNAICEVTMLNSRDQWINEGQPVMRHLRDFEMQYPNKNSYCLFIAPSIHRDTYNTFKSAIEFKYEGAKQKIIPISIQNFINILKILYEIKNRKESFSHLSLKRLYDNLLDKAIEIEQIEAWNKGVPLVIKDWEETLANK